MTKQFIVYLRVSTAKQGVDGNGIEAQRKACVDHLRGGDIVGEFTEVESGRKNRRPQLDAALAQCAKSGATLLVAKLDRLSRNVAFVSRLLDSGVEFVAADQPFANSLTIHLLAAAAAVGARTAHSANALAYAKSVHPVIEKIQAGGAITLRDIASELNERKIETPARQAKIDKDKPVYGRAVWHPQQVKAVIDRIAA